MVVDKHSVEHTLQLLSKTTRKYFSSLALPFEGKKIDFVLLLGSYTESLLTDAASETALYLDVLQSHVPPGSTVLMKSHPASSEAKASQLRAEASKYYDVEVGSFGEFPIELFASSFLLQPFFLFLMPL